MQEKREEEAKETIASFCRACKNIMCRCGKAQKYANRPLKPFVEQNDFPEKTCQTKRFTTGKSRKKSQVAENKNKISIRSRREEMVE